MLWPDEEDEPGETVGSTRLVHPCEGAVHLLSGGSRVLFGNRIQWEPAALSCGVPDLADPATLGCVLAVVLNAHGFDAERDNYETGHMPGAGAFLTLRDRTWTGDTAGDVLATALEAAPEVKG